MEGPDTFPGGGTGGVLGQKRRCMSALEPVTRPAGDEEEEEEEEEGGFRGVPLRRSCALRTSIRSRDPFRRHSWEPGKELRGIPGYDQLSVSLKGLSPEDIGSSAEGLGGHRRDPRRAPLLHSRDDLESLLSQDEEDEADVQRAQEDARELPPCRGTGGLSKSASLSIIDSFPDPDEISPFSSRQSLVNG
ncbi:A-kinase anchor protein 13-like [Apus apus]|uniref:A-kinase anchor protein 13-like n=1 Tax=Apus apus TaxID=8895 RepID=UPI0021F913CC|nr:A-kinase anchor protein 13-like [Apus apus]